MENNFLQTNNTAEKLFWMEFRVSVSTIYHGILKRMQQEDFIILS